jgi:alanine-synthesizing transaminase
MFAWAPIPEKFRHLGSLEFSKLLIEQADVAVAPGIGFGEHGDDYVRLAFVENEHRIRQAARSIKKFVVAAIHRLTRPSRLPLMQAAMWLRPTRRCLPDLVWNSRPSPRTKACS